MEFPEPPSPEPLPDDSTPRPLAPTFKDIYMRKREEMQKSAEGMESMLVRQVLKVMRSTIPEPMEDEDMFGTGSHATQMFTQMMDDELADKIAQNGNFGIADNIFKTNINRLTQDFADQLATGQMSPIGLPLPPR